jgi:hypothetical protein
LLAEALVADGSIDDLAELYEQVIVTFAAHLVRQAVQ